MLKPILPTLFLCSCNSFNTSKELSPTLNILENQLLVKMFETLLGLVFLRTLVKMTVFLQRHLTGSKPHHSEGDVSLV